MDDAKRQAAALALGQWFVDRYQGNYSVGDLEGTKLTYIDIEETDMLDLVDVVLGALRDV